MHSWGSLRALSTGVRSASALVPQVAQTVVSVNKAVAAATTAGLNDAVRPLRVSAGAIASVVTQGGAQRNHWSNGKRAWIEVRGLHDAAGAQLGREVVAALRAQRGVRSVKVNRAVSRVVIELNPESASLRELCRVIGRAETRHRARCVGPVATARPEPLPADSALLAKQAVAVGVDTVGVAVTLVGRALRWPRLPVPVSAAVTALNHQPRLRGLIEERIGPSSTDTVLKYLSSSSYIFALAPTSLLIDLALDVLRSGESLAGEQVWRICEPAFAGHADSARPAERGRPIVLSPGPIERHAGRAAAVQAAAATTAGLLTGDLETAAAATLVSAPKAARATREAFAAELGRGLARRHSVLALRPGSLRCLDRVDALVVDPRVLSAQSLRVARVRGAGDDELAAAWMGAQQLLEGTGDLAAGWHRLPGASARPGVPPVEALISPALDPMVQPVLAEARRAGLELVSVDGDALGESRSVFDELRPAGREVDDALSAAVTHLQEQGRTVAVLSSVAAQALSLADIGLGVMPCSEEDAAPFTADVILPNLVAVWHVLHAVPAAKTASRRGIEIASGASALGALLMLPGVRGGGPGPVTSGAAAGVVSGFLLARGALSASTPAPAPVQEWHAMSVERVRTLLGPGNTGEATSSRGPVAALAVAAAHGGVRLAQRPPLALQRFATAVRAELSDPLTPVLALGSAASAILGSPVDAVLVGSVLTGNAVLAASQRLRTESRLDKLLSLQIPPARTKVMGVDGVVHYRDVDAAQLRPGDLIEVRTHEVVPADARLIAADDLEVDESTLSGESLPVDKHTEPTPGADLSERRCMLYAETTVVAGTGVAVVTAVGPQTQVRRAAELTAGDPPTIGLQHQLRQLTDRALPVSLAGGGVVSALALLRRRGLREAVASGVAVAVAAVPEGMPLVATLAQAAAARHLSQHGALVRVPRSVEALGRVGVVCFDKTGTLTENRLRVARIHPATGCSPLEVMRHAARAALDSSRGPAVHATDRAIVEAALADDSPAGSWSATAPDAHFPFRSGRACSASVYGDELVVKGAPEVVLAACAADGSAADAADTVRELANDGLRVIAVARRRLDPRQIEAIQRDDDVLAELVQRNLTLTGLLGLSDTRRSQATELLNALSDRGMPVRLITGDHPITAAAIAREMGLAVTDDQVISGVDWDRCSRQEQERAVVDRVVFARMSPEQKVQIVQTVERTGEVCAMVGDGSNDAAAIRAATVGIAVVDRGSDPARTAADVVLVDAKIEALLDALDEGTRLWQRVEGAVSVLLGGNAGEIGFAIIGSAIAGQSPLNTRQLLLVNMLTDALPAAALAVSTPSKSLQHRKLGADYDALMRAIAVRGTTTAAAATTAWAMAALTGRPRRASTVALVALVSAQLGQTLLESRTPLVILTAGGSLATLGTLISIPGVSQLMGCTPLGPIGWAQALTAAGTATVAVPLIASPSAHKLRDTARFLTWR